MESEFGDNDGLDDFEPGAYGGSTTLVHDEEDEHPGRRNGALIPRFVAPIDLEGEFDSDEIVQFFDLVTQHYGHFEIAISLGWSPYQLKRFVEDPERAEILEMLRQAKIDTTERAMMRGIESGNATLIRTMLFCQARDRGWSDTRKIQIEAESRTEIVLSVREAVGAIMAQAKTPEQVAAIQSAYLDDSDVTDAEIVE